MRSRRRPHSSWSLAFDQALALRGDPARRGGERGPCEREEEDDEQDLRGLEPPTVLDREGEPDERTAERRDRREEVDPVDDVLHAQRGARRRDGHRDTRDEQRTRKS